MSRRSDLMDSGNATPVSQVELSARWRAEAKANRDQARQFADNGCTGTADQYLDAAVMQERHADDLDALRTQGPDLRELLLEKALAYHKAMDGTGEGEYGCPGVECPGVKRLAAFAAECVDAALNAIPVVQQQDEWQPIETAPRDGAAVLLISQTRTAHMQYTGYWKNGEWWLMLRPHPPVLQEPDYWRPLPLPPSPPSLSAPPQEKP